MRSWYSVYIFQTLFWVILSIVILLPDLIRRMPECSGVMGEEYESVPLQPFLHQVSGHTGMFQYDDKTVCKPLNVREYNFYLNVPHNLKQFTAEFRGKNLIHVYCSLKQFTAEFRGKNLVYCKFTYMVVCCRAQRYEPHTCIL